jgi:hypothetical protein
MQIFLLSTNHHPSRDGSLPGEGWGGAASSTSPTGCKRIWPLCPNIGQGFLVSLHPLPHINPHYQSPPQSPHVVTTPHHMAWYPCIEASNEINDTKITKHLQRGKIQ